MILMLMNVDNCPKICHRNWTCATYAGFWTSCLQTSDNLHVYWVSVLNYLWKDLKMQKRLTVPWELLYVDFVVCY